MAETSAQLTRGQVAVRRDEPRVALERWRDADAGLHQMIRDVRAGLGSTLPSIPSTYLYDDRGSALFEEITGLEEYYQTRTEESLLEDVAGAIVAEAGPREVLELGSGAGRKIRLLLDAMARRQVLERCTLLDINESFLAFSSRRLAREYPGLRVRGAVGDFTRDLHTLGRAEDRMVVFFAGTFGNLEPASVPGFLAAVRAVIGRNGWFLVGLDLVKDVAVLERAYNDSAGVTAEFNRNILRVLNARLGADFDPDAFTHVAFYDPDNAWIEMRLRATRAMRASVPAAEVTLDLEAGDEIRTEISCKYTRSSFTDVLAGSGFALHRWFTDPEARFALALVAPAEDGSS